MCSVFKVWYALRSLRTPLRSLREKNLLISRKDRHVKKQ